MTQAIKDPTNFYKSGYPKENNMLRSRYNLKVNSGLKAARRLKGLSIPKVQKALQEQGHSYGLSTLASYEADEKSTNHRYPSLHTLVILANLYECSMDFIFGISANSKPSNIDDLKKLLQTNRIVKWDNHVLSPEEKQELIYRFEKNSIDVLELLDDDFPLTWQEKDIKIEHRNMIKLKATQIMNL